MPNKTSKNRRQNARRMVKRGARNSRPQINSENPFMGFSTSLSIAPRIKKVVLPWTLTRSVTTTDSASGRYYLVLEASNPYDPNFSDGTSTYQPQGYDAYSAFYTYWFVTHCALQFELINNNASKTLAIAVGPSPDQLETTYKIQRNLIWTHSKLLPAIGVNSYKTAMMHSTAQVRDTNPRDNNSYRSSFGSPAALFWYYVITIETLDLSSFTCDFEVTLLYHMELNTPKKVAYS